jgi:uncharacterized lipoprotein
MNMKKTTILLCVLAALAGCGSDKERTDYIGGATKGRPLDMPPDLVLPKIEGKYVVPNGSTETSATYSEYARAGALQGQTCVCQNAGALPASAVAVAPAPLPAPATLQDRPGGRKVIVMAEPFDRCWLRVSQAMDAAAINAEDKDRSKGLFYLEKHNELSVQAKSSGAAPSCEVSASDGSGNFSVDARRIIDALYKALGPQ